MSERSERIFATLATSDQDDAGVGVVWWAARVEGGYALKVLDYKIDEMPAVDADWIGSLFRRSVELDSEHRPAQRGCLLRVEHRGLVDLVKRADGAFRDTEASQRLNRSEFDIRPIRQSESSKWPPTLEERISAIRPLVNSGRCVKLTPIPWFSFRAIRTNHLVSQILRRTDAANAGELLHAFVLGVLIGTTREGSSFFEAMARAQNPPDSTPSAFAGKYLPGKRPL